MYHWLPWLKLSSDPDDNNKQRHRDIGVTVSVLGLDYVAAGFIIQHSNRVKKLQEHNGRNLDPNSRHRRAHRSTNHLVVGRLVI